MDFWDLTVLVFRRWKVALPLLLVAIGATVSVALLAKPDYTMTAYVQLIPAKFAPSDNPNASLRNQWNQLGLDTLGQASVYATQDQQFIDFLKDNKYSDTFTLTITHPNPIITVEVVGSSRAQVRSTAQLVIDRLRQSAQTLQTGAGVRTADLIATQRLDQGENLLPSHSKVKRAAAAVAVAGLMLTAGGTVAFDAFVRRRAGKRKAREEEAESSPDISSDPSPEETMVGHGSGEPAGSPSAGKPSKKSADQPARAARTGTSTVVESPSTAIRRTSKVVKRFSATQSTRRPQAATYRSVNAQPEANGDGHDAPVGAANGDSTAIASDVRVVLQPKWMGGENGGKTD